MSSGTPYTPDSSRQMLHGLASRTLGSRTTKESMAEAQERISRLGLSPRQQDLNRLWCWYRCESYTARKIDWDGKEAVDPIDHEAIASAGFIPPGFYSAGADLPIKFRKPTAPYALVKVIVDRFTGLLFSERHNPQIRVEGDPDTEDFVTALAETARLWPSLILARTYGGAMGTVCVGFQFLNGKPIIEVHDPRWVIPTFVDRSTQVVHAIEKRYMYPMDELDISGIYRTVWYWYRRVIDEEKDVLFKPAPVDAGDEPQWEVEKEVAHGLGFCPVVWIQNLPVQDEVDGDPDCLGIYEMVQAIDVLIAQANRAIVGNCDPTLLLTTDAQLGQVAKGSDNAIKLPQGGSGQYIEIQGSGPDAALKLAEQLRKYALEVAQCVLEHPEMSQRTATEIDRVYSAMISKADVLREQYGEKGIKTLLEMMVAAVRKLGEGKVNEETGELEKQVIRLPNRVITNEDGTTTSIPRKLGASMSVALQWPKYFEPLLTDVELATRSAVAGLAGGLLDMEHASKFVAEYFRVEDVQRMLKQIKKEAEKREAQSSFLSAMGGALGGGAP